MTPDRPGFWWYRGPDGEVAVAEAFRGWKPDDPNLYFYVFGDEVGRVIGELADCEWIGEASPPGPDDLAEALALLRGSRRAVAADARRAAEMLGTRAGHGRLARIDALLARYPAKEPAR